MIFDVVVPAALRSYIEIQFDTEVEYDDWLSTARPDQKIFQRDLIMEGPFGRGSKRPPEAFSGTMDAYYRRQLQAGQSVTITCFP